MGKFRDGLQNFMIGRYGMDPLNNCLLIASVVVLVLNWIFKVRFLWLIALALLVYTYVRMLSKDFNKRQGENQAYLRFTGKIRSWFRLQRSRWQDRKTHVYYRCPKCGAALRVPKGRGRIQINCRQCGHHFEKTT